MKCICILDVESTGVDHKKDELLEIGGALVDLSFDVYAPISEPFRILIVPTKDLTVSLPVLKMHSESGLWKELSEANKLMGERKQEVIQLEARKFAVRAQHAWSVFRQMMTKIKEPLGKRATLGGKNVDFDLRFLKEKLGEGVAEYFRARKADPGMLWMREGDSAVPSLEECLKRTEAQFGKPPHEIAFHNSLADVTATAWTIRGGLRRLGLYNAPMCSVCGVAWHDHPQDCIKPKETPTA
jgi:oligoribonuclease (3'-5' exoribonuclease)